MHESPPPSTTAAAAKLTPQQLALSSFVERAARCLTAEQVAALRAPFSEQALECQLCHSTFWGRAIGVALPSQRHHCYACGKTLCNVFLFFSFPCFGFSFFFFRQ